jgi:hypothetical protein
MKKLLILTLAALMLLGSVAYATNTRVMVMGESNNILLDEANIWLYPSRINMYPNIAIAEVGVVDNDYYFDDQYGTLAQFGVHWKFCEKNPWVLGTYLSHDRFSGTNYDGQLGIGYQMLPFRYPSYDLIDNGWFPWPPTPTSWEGNQRITLFYGRKLGNTPFGFRFSKFHSSWKQEGSDPTSPKNNQSLGEYDFAFGLTDQNGKWDATIGVNLLTWTYQNSSGVDLTKPSGNMSIYAQGRLFKQINPQWTIVPNAGIIFGTYEAEFYNGGSPTNTQVRTESYMSTTFWAGLGAQYTPVTNVLAVVEGGFGYNNSKIENKPVAGTTSAQKANFLTLPYIRIGLEGKVFDWMDLRAGANSYWQRAKFEDEPNPFGEKEKFNYPDDRTFIGAGLHFGNLHIDTYTNPAILLNGFNFISGNSTSDLNAWVTLLYEFK